MRGKLAVAPAIYAFGGLIPAYAGKTVASWQGEAGPWAHPRVCGENHCGGGYSDRVGGSSPRMRGKPIDRFAGRAGKRLIPAYAGKT